MPSRDVFRRERRGVRHGAAEAEPGEKAQHAEGRHTIGEGNQDRQHTKRHDAADERHPPAQAISDEPADRAADHHADHAGRQSRGKRRARQAPFVHERGHGRAEHLVVEAVENDGECGARHEKLLVGAPLSVVEQRADVDRFHLLSCPVKQCAILPQSTQSTPSVF